MKEQFDLMLSYVLTVNRVLMRCRPVANNSKVINTLVALRGHFDKQRDAELYLKEN